MLDDDDCAPGRRGGETDVAVAAVDLERLHPGVARMDVVRVARGHVGQSVRAAGDQEHEQQRAKDGQSETEHDHSPR